MSVESLVLAPANARINPIKFGTLSKTAFYQCVLGYLSTTNSLTQLEIASIYLHALFLGRIRNSPLVFSRAPDPAAVGDLVIEHTSSGSSASVVGKSSAPTAPPPTPPLPATAFKKLPRPAQGVAPAPVQPLDLSKLQREHQSLPMPLPISFAPSIGAMNSAAIFISASDVVRTLACALRIAPPDPPSTHDGVLLHWCLSYIASKDAGGTLLPSHNNDSIALALEWYSQLTSAGTEHKLPPAAATITHVAAPHPKQQQKAQPQQKAQQKAQTQRTKVDPLSPSKN